MKYRYSLEDMNRFESVQDYVKRKNKEAEQAEAKKRNRIETATAIGFNAFMVGVMIVSGIIEGPVK
jgi:hypothetical protein